MKFIAWKLYAASDEAGSPLDDTKTYSAAFALLEKLGFEVVPHVYLDNRYPDEVSRRDALETEMEALQQDCAAKGFPIDGLVGSFNDVAYGLSLGSTGHHPKHSLAFKFYQDRNETVLRDIEWSTNRTGQVNPVAIFDPVEIDGTTVSRASLNNVSIIKELELGLGDTITVIKANQIIPMVTDNLTRSGSYVFPTVCGSCGKPLELRNDNGREMLYCVNSHCPAIQLDQITYFVSRDAMNILGLSQERLKLLIDRGFVRDFADLYHLDAHREELMEMERLGQDSVDNLLSAIDASRNCRMSNVLTAIGIPTIGKNNAKILAAQCAGEGNPLERFLELAKDNYDWSVLDGFGDVMSSAINQYVADNEDRIRPLLDVLNIAPEQPRQRAAWRAKPSASPESSSIIPTGMPWLRTSKERRQGGFRCQRQDKLSYYQRQGFRQQQKPEGRQVRHNDYFRGRVPITDCRGRSVKTKRIALLGLLTAIALTIFMIEAQIPAVIPIPGVKLGLSNIVTVFTVFTLGPWDGVAVLACRIFLGAVFAGNFSTILYSAAGGFLSILVTMGLRKVLKENQIWAAAAWGAIAHSVGQMIAAIAITRTPGLLVYLPVLVIISIFTGLFTGFCAQLLIKRGGTRWKTILK